MSTADMIIPQQIHMIIPQPIPHVEGHYASRDESRKSEHVTRCGLNAATRDMAATAEAEADAQPASVAPKVGSH